ncbi:hypothetical protein AB834_01770 [PVC group bacterium (ex Bugula neritina AB1)]|nr:hypothetical protein AB834_01770 [PVC group bacterium (ex Bugula neritina AB1)]
MKKITLSLFFLASVFGLNNLVAGPSCGGHSSSYSLEDVYGHSHHNNEDTSEESAEAAQPQATLY